MDIIAIVGAGLIGRAWAVVFARAGHAVRLWDHDPSVVPHAMVRIEDAVAACCEAGMIADERGLVMRRIRPCSTIEEAVSAAGYVQENAAEHLEVKQAVFARMDACASPDAILASSTSTIPASFFTEGLAGRHRCIVSHPVNPPHLVPVVEVVPAPWTAPDVIARTARLLEQVGQSPVLVRKEVPGFIVNRLQAALLMEAWRLVKDGCCSAADLDTCLKDGLGLRWSFMGPFETIDLNAPGGISDYARRYGDAMYDALKDRASEPWDAEVVAQVDGERRAILPASHRAAREAWRDRRLMALLAHKRAMSRQEPE